MRAALTIRQRKYVEAIVRHGNGTQAVIDAGYNVRNRKVAKVISSENLQKQTIQQAISAAFISQDMTPEKLAQIHYELLHSKNSRVRLQALRLLYRTQQHV